MSKLKLALVLSLGVNIAAAFYIDSERQDYDALSKQLTFTKLGSAIEQQERTRPGTVHLLFSDDAINKSVFVRALQECLPGSLKIAPQRAGL